MKFEKFDEELPEVGMVLGKFMPLHAGHEFLIHFGRQYCKKLIVIVDCLEEQTTSPELRKHWIEEQVPGVEVIVLTKYMPQLPEDTAEFWGIWRDALVEAMGGRPDVFIASGDYGWKLAKVLGCKFVQCDISRESLPISATEIRANPYKHWKYLAASARGHYLKKVCFMGPESAGKSTCAANVARHFETAFVPEYAKGVIECQQGQFFEENVAQVGVAQFRSEIALARLANRILICDTDPLTTLIWSEFLYGRHPAILDDLVRKADYALTLLFDAATPFVPAPHRAVLDNGGAQEVRCEFLKQCEKWLTHFNRPYVLVGGSFDERFETSVRHCEQLIA